MVEHYFTGKPESAAEPNWWEARVGDVRLRLATDRGVFSRDHLDPGSRALIEAADVHAAGTVLDLGAGYGAVGLFLKALYPALALTLVEVNARAAQLARLSAEANRLPVEVLVGDGLEPVRERRFGACVCNPPIRAGKALYYGWFERLREILVPGGDLYVVVRRSHGAESLQKALEGWYEQVEIVSRDSGVRVLRAKTQP